LVTDFSIDVELYTPAGAADPNTVPVLLEAPVPVTAATRTRSSDDLRALPDRSGELVASERPVTTLARGASYELVGERLSGVTQGTYYGDDEQAYTNFPLVRVTNAASGEVTYFRTYAHSSRSIAHDARASTRFDVPGTTPTGEAYLEIVANGVPSPQVLVDVR